MNLTQIIYVSRASARLAPATLEAIIAQSATNNARLGVTGILYACGTSMMQLLEGDAAVVDALYSRIAKDTRHTEVEVLLRKTVAKRLYPEWGMGLSDLRSRLITDRLRMVKLIDDVRQVNNTAQFSVEARVLLRDFQQQAITTAAA